MNIANKAIAAITLTCASLSAANAANITHDLIPANTEAGTKLCIVAGEGQVHKMKRAIKAAKVDKYYVLRKVTCNQQDIISFVEQYGKNVEDMSRYLTNGKYKKGILVSKVSAD